LAVAKAADRVWKEILAYDLKGLVSATVAFNRWKYHRGVRRYLTRPPPAKRQKLKEEEVISCDANEEMMPIMQKYHGKAAYIMKYGGKFLKVMVAKPDSLEEFTSWKALKPVLIFMEQEKENMDSVMLEHEAGEQFCKLPKAKRDTAFKAMVEFYEEIKQEMQRN